MKVISEALKGVKVKDEDRTNVKDDKAGVQSVLVKGRPVS